MNKRIWLGGLFLSLGGCASGLLAQDPPGKLPILPAPVSLAKLQVGTGPAVAILPPVPVTPEDFRPVRIQQGGVVPAVYQAQADSPAGAQTLPTWADVDTGDDQPSGFAEDRVVRQVADVQAGPLGLPIGPAAITPALDGGLRDKQPTQPQFPAELLPPQPPHGPPQALPPGLDVPQHVFWTPPSNPDPLRHHFYVAAEYLYWWTKADHAPPLVTTSDPNNVNPNGRFGFIGQPGTTTLFGGDGINSGGSSGFRVTAGCWLDMFQEEGLEVSGFLLSGKSTHFNASSANFPVLARPFFNLNSNTEFSELVAFPGLSTGSVAVNTTSQLWGIEGNLRCNLFCCCDQRLDVFGGFRYLDLQESIAVVEDIQGSATAPAPFTNQHAEVFDRFATHNSFYGAQLGADYEYRMGRWFVDVKGKLGIGVTNSVIDINGGQTFFNADGSVRSSVAGGLLALNSNIGRFNKDHFSFVPEIGLNLGYQVNDNVRVFAGYNFLYWTGVMRAGDQINRNLDVTRIPNFPVAATPLTQVQPSVPFKTTDFWAQGINVGIEFRY